MNTVLDLGASVEVQSRDELDSEEVLLWTIMRTFEVQACGQYRTCVPDLATRDKESVGKTLLSIAGGDGPLEASLLGPTMRALVGSAAEARRDDAVLVIQGLVLERIRQLVYATLARVPGTPERTKAIARAFQPVSTEIVERAPQLFVAACARESRSPFSLFAEASDDVLHKLDAVGEGVDEVFGERFGLRFTDIVADFVADLVPTCVKLGMDRRKVMSHLAGALMGI